MFRAIAKVSFISIVAIMAMVLLLAWMGSGYAKKNAGLFERAGVTVDRMIDKVA